MIIDEDFWKKLEMYARSGGQFQDICNILDTNKVTLNNMCMEHKGMSFEDYRAKQYSIANIHLLAKEYSMAMQGDKTMMEYLVTTRLGQSKINCTVPTKNHNQCLKPNKPLQNGPTTEPTENLGED